jgi:holliday junction DNA helicase RuvB
MESRFFIVRLEPYTYEQFCEITKQLLSHHKVDGGVASVIANAVWNKSRDIRDCVRIGKLARSAEDVGFIVDTNNRMIGE